MVSWVRMDAFVSVAISRVGRNCLSMLNNVWWMKVSSMIRWTWFWCEVLGHAVLLCSGQRSHTIWQMGGAVWHVYLHGGQMGAAVRHVCTNMGTVGYSCKTCVLTWRTVGCCCKILVLTRGTVWCCCKTCIPTWRTVGCCCKTYVLTWGQLGAAVRHWY